MIKQEVMELTKSTIINYLSSNIKCLRRKAGFSQEELAQQIGLNRGNIASYENGTAEPKICNLLKLSKIFGVSIMDLTMKDLMDEVNQIEAKLKYENLNVSDARQIAHFNEKADMLEDYLEGLNKCFTYKRSKAEAGEIPGELKFAFDFYEQAYDAAQNLLKEHRQLISYLRCQEHENAEE
jgi:transcriptional regulator with XRE-family HTH domain